MDPFIQPSDDRADLPLGWITESIGPWHGVDSHIAYHPRRHDVIVQRGPGDRVDRPLGDGGYLRQLTAPEGDVWVRDRVALMRTQLDRLGTDHGHDHAPLERARV